MAGIFFRQKFHGSRHHILDPKLQRLPLFLCEDFQNLNRIPTPVPDFVRAVCLKMFHHRIFRPSGCWTVTQKDVVHQIELVPGDRTRPRRLVEDQAQFLLRVGVLLIRLGVQSGAAFSGLALATVAEVCCGQGDVPRLLGQRVGRGVGVDISPDMLAAAVRSNAGSAFTFVQGDATSLPLRDGVFDCVVMSGGIHHVNDRRRLFAEVARVLRPGGALVWREPVNDFFAWRWLRAVIYRAAPGLDAETESPLTYDGTVPRLTEAGLALEAWRPCGFLGFCLLMNSDVLVFNRLLRYWPGIRMLASTIGSPRNPRCAKSACRWWAWPGKLPDNGRRRFAQIDGFTLSAGFANHIGRGLRRLVVRAHGHLGQ